MFEQQSPDTGCEMLSEGFDFFIYLFLFWPEGNVLILFSVVFMLFEAGGC